MDSNLVIFSLEYTYLIKPRHNIFESSIGLWQDHSEWSRALIPYSVSDHHKQQDISIIDNISELRSSATMLNHNGLNETNHIKLIEPQLNNKLITISINGSETFVNNSRAEIMNIYTRVGFRRITLTTFELEALCGEFLHRLDSLALRYGVEIIISDCEPSFDGSPTKSEMTSIFILGDEKNLGNAEYHTKVLIDTILNGYYVERVSIPWLSIPFLGGAVLSNLTEITRQSKVTVRYPDAWSLTFEYESSGKKSEVFIWLTSSSLAELALTKNALAEMLDLANMRMSNKADIFFQRIDTSKDKLDLIYLHHQSDLRKIMLEHDTIVTRCLDTEAGGQITRAQGPVFDSVLEASQCLSFLSCGLHRLEISLSQGTLPADLEYFFISLVHRRKTCVLTLNQHGINILGSKHEIDSLLKELISDLKNHHFFSKLLMESENGFQIALKMELSNAHKDFLAGKKNGKIIKILNQLGFTPTIEFTKLNDFNFCIRSSISVGPPTRTEQLHTAFNILLRTVDLLELELPAELQFNVPEVFHKSLIGNGGSIIQSIMKKYNVFIKFSRDSLDEASPQKNGNGLEQDLHQFKRKNNVIIRCPMKNSRSIMCVKYEIDQLVFECCQSRTSPFNDVSVIYNTAKIRLLRSHFLLLNRQMKFNPRFIHDLEIKFSTFIDYPRSIDAFEDRIDFLLTIKGNERKARLCAEELARLLPKSMTFDVCQAVGDSSVAFDFTNPEFREEVVIPLSLLLRTELVVESISNGYYNSRMHEITLSSYDERFLARAATELIEFSNASGLMAKERQLSNYSPIVSIDEVISPSKSPSKYSQRSPLKSPSKYAGRSPEKSPRKNTSKSGSPHKSGKKPLGVITNHQNGTDLKSIPQLNHQENYRVLF